MKEKYTTEELVFMIKGAVRYVELAEALPEPSEKKRAYLDHARRILADLNSNLDLDRGGEIAFNLLRLYIFINRRLADAMGGDLDGLIDGLRILRHVRDAWVRAAEIEGQKAN